jgi:hypothetical protein
MPENEVAIPPLHEKRAQEAQKAQTQQENRMVADDLSGKNPVDAQTGKPVDISDSSSIEALKNRIANVMFENGLPQGGLKLRGIDPEKLGAWDRVKLRAGQPISAIDLVKFTLFAGAAYFVYQGVSYLVRDYWEMPGSWKWETGKAAERSLAVEGAMAKAKVPASAVGVMR